LQWDAAAAARFDLISGRRIRIGTSDLRIAAIVMANGARLLSRNLKDFQRIEELDVENWLD
jgi:tRNA(fMet)-specific endonuclease VapC